MGYTKATNLMQDPLLEYINAKNKLIEDPKDVEESQEWFQNVIMDYAYENNLVPIECIETVQVSETMDAKIIVWKEC